MAQYIEKEVPLPRCAIPVPDPVVSARLELPRRRYQVVDGDSVFKVLHLYVHHPRTHPGELVYRPAYALLHILMKPLEKNWLGTPMVSPFVSSPSRGMGPAPCGHWWNPTGRILLSP